MKNRILIKNGGTYWQCKGIVRKIRISIQGEEKIVFVHPTDDERKNGVRIRRMKWAELEVADEIDDLIKQPGKH